MQSLLILPRIKVENANAISGIVYGFPAVTHFLGYVHALSREVDARIGVKLGGCGIVCHDYQVHAHEIGGGRESLFSLTRNPLSKDGSTASFNEEGRIRMEVSLIIECDFTSDNFDFATGNADQDKQKLRELVYQLAVAKRLAGGLITEMSPVDFEEIPQKEDEQQLFFRNVRRKLLPGFVLRDRSDIFKRYLSDNPQINPLEALLDFYTLKSKATLPSEGKAIGNDKVKWERVSKPFGGWLVPIQCGYKAISPLYEKGEVACVRDREVPFRFVEPVYGLGEWVGLHRIQDMEAIVWRYRTEHDMYVCLNNSND
jgi:CRISPR-associated protein Csy2